MQSFVSKLDWQVVKQIQLYLSIHLEEQVVWLVLYQDDTGADSGTILLISGILYITAHIYWYWY